MMILDSGLFFAPPCK